jgi:hypothetical protein
LSQYDAEFKENRDKILRKRLIIKLVNFASLAILLIVAPVVGFKIGSDTKSYFYEAQIFQSLAVILALIIFAVSLIRINNVVKGIDGAFPKRANTVAHFGLVFGVLFFNMINLIDFLAEYSFSENCSTGLNIVYFIYAIDTWIWDCFELCLNMLLLYIVSSSADSISSKSDS